MGCGDAGIGCSVALLDGVSGIGCSVALLDGVSGIGCSVAGAAGCVCKGGAEGAACLSNQLLTALWAAGLYELSDGGEDGGLAVYLLRRFWIAFNRYCWSGGVVSSQEVG